MDIFNHGSHFKDKRHAMVESQIRARGISDIRVLNALSEVPRDCFVPPEYKSDAYADCPLPIGEGQTISQPYMVALMTQSLELRENSKVLEIGTGSGYQMAVLLKITPFVYSVERIPELALKAEASLLSVGFNTIKIKVDDGTCGWPEEAPFDGIIVTSGAPSVPEFLKAQLAEEGRLVIPVGTRHSQVLYKIIRKGNDFTADEITHCIFVPLIGKYAWDEKAQHGFR